MTAMTSVARNRSRASERIDHRARGWYMPLRASRSTQTTAYSAVSAVVSGTYGSQWMLQSSPKRTTDVSATVTAARTPSVSMSSARSQDACRRSMMRQPTARNGVVQWYRGAKPNRWAPSRARLLLAGHAGAHARTIGPMPPRTALRTIGVMRLSFDRLWVFLAIAVPALVALIVPLPAVDLAYQVRTGDLILATGSIPAVDTYTFTATGAPWTDQQWLAQVLLAIGYRLGGWELLAVVRASLVAGTFGLLVAASAARGASIRTSSILSLLAFVVAAPALALRPQLFGIAIFAALVLLVADRHRHPRRLWLAPVLVVLWANVHGSVVLAPVLLGYAWLEDVVLGRNARLTLGVLAVGTLATLVNPFGIGVWGYALDVGTNPEITGRVAEWQHTSPLTVPGLLFYGSAAAVSALLVARRRLVTWPSVLWIGFLFALGVWTVRALAWWPLGVVLVVARSAAGCQAGATTGAQRPQHPGRGDRGDRHRRRLAVVAAHRSAGRSSRAAHVCAVLIGDGAAGRRCSGESCVCPPDVGVMVRVGGARCARVRRLAYRALRRRHLAGIRHGDRGSRGLAGRARRPVRVIPDRASRRSSCGRGCC